MKNITKFTGITVLAAVMIFAMAACGGGGGNGVTGGTTPTLTLTPDNVTVNNGNLKRTVSVGGTAAGTVTLDASALPAGVTAAVNGATITVTGVRPATNVPPIKGSFTVVVTREGVTENLTVDVNLTTTWVDPFAPLTLSPDSVTIDDGNLTQNVSVGGTAAGTITLDTSALPAEVTATVSGTTITVTGVRPATNVPAIKGTFTVVVTREGVKQNLTVDVNLTTTWVDPSLVFNSLPPGLYLGAPSTLTASSAPISSVPANNVNDAVTHINTNPEEYTLLISADINAGNQNLSANVKLTVIGIGGEKTIQYNGPVNKNFFFMNSAGASLTLGQNITLRGIAAGGFSLVEIYNGSLTMLAGSKITGHTVMYGAAFAAVYIDAYSAGANSSFTMYGGEITGNHARSMSSFNGGGVGVSEGAVFTMSGGSITGNTRKDAPDTEAMDVRLCDTASIIKAVKTGGTIGVSDPAEPW